MYLLAYTWIALNRSAICDDPLVKDKPFLILNPQQTTLARPAFLDERGR